MRGDYESFQEALGNGEFHLARNILRNNPEIGDEITKEEKRQIRKSILEGFETGTLIPDI
jgi:hypothetical protein